MRKRRGMMGLIPGMKVQYGRPCGKPILIDHGLEVFEMILSKVIWVHFPLLSS
jgi:hypothetical protein